MPDSAPLPLTLPSSVRETAERVLEDERRAGLVRLATGRLVVAAAAGVAVLVARPPLLAAVMVGVYALVAGSTWVLARAQAARWQGLRRVSGWAVPLVDFPIFALSLGPVPSVWVAASLCLVIVSSLTLSLPLVAASGAVGLGLSLLVASRAGFTPDNLALLALAYAVAVAVLWVVTRRLLGLALEMRRQDWLGRYRVGPRLGAGGMAEVFAGTARREDGSERPVAIKRILTNLSAREDVQALFRRELEISTLMLHPNIVQVLDFGEDERGPFLVMELVDGTSLANVLQHVSARGQALSLEVLLLLANKVAAALDHIHTRRGPDGELLRLVHRDLNPPNVLVSRLGEPKVSDFGVARGEGALGGTATGVVRGKVSYASPEQLRGAKADAGFDLFAFGLLLAEACLGHHPYQDDTTGEVSVERLLAGGVPAELRGRAQLPPPFLELLGWLLEADPTRRCPSAAQALDRLRPLAFDAEAARAELARLVSDEADEGRTRPS